MQQAPFGFDAAMQHEAATLQERIGSLQVRRGHAGYGPEENIHQPENQPAANAPQSSRRNLEIGNQPVRVQDRGGREPIDEALQLIFAKAIQEEIRRDEVESFDGRPPIQNIRLNEINPACLHPVPFEAAPGLVEHRSAGIHANHTSTLETAATFNEEASMTLACQQDVPDFRHGVDEPGAAALQFFSRQDKLHPAVMRGQYVKAH